MGKEIYLFILFVILKDREAMMRQLACTNDDDFDDKKLLNSATTQDATSASTTAPKTTKPWIWTSNTVDTGEFGQPTRHRRETEDTMTPISSTKSTNDLLATTQPTFVPEKKTPIEQTTTKPSTEDTGEYPETINQGQLFSIIENGTMFDIIELNENGSTTDDGKGPKTSTPASKSKKSAQSELGASSAMANPGNGDVSTTTKTVTVTLTSASASTPTATSTPVPTQAKTDVVTVLTTTVLYHKEPTEVPTTVTKNQPAETLNDLATNIRNNDKTLNKEVETYTGLLGDSMAKLNRTFRKRLPLYEQKDVIDNSLDVDGDGDGDAKELHHTVENATLLVTTKKILKEIDPTIEKLNNVSDKFLNNQSESVHPTTLMDRIENMSSEEIMRQRTVAPKLEEEFIIAHKKPMQAKKAGVEKPTKRAKSPKVEEATQSNSADNEKNPQPQQNRTIKTSGEQVDKVELASGEPQEPDTTEPSEVDAETEAEPEPEAQPRPNRQRQLTRPQRRSFYPYFFSRVLG